MLCSSSLRSHLTHRSSPSSPAFGFVPDGTEQRFSRSETLTLIRLLRLHNSLRTQRHLVLFFEVFSIRGRRKTINQYEMLYSLNDYCYIDTWK